MFCEHPSFILSHTLRSDVLRCKRLLLAGNLRVLSHEDVVLYSDSFPWHLFYAYKHSLNEAEPDVRKRAGELYAAVECDGSLTPLFQEVPCGKCLLCAQKSVMEWKFRCVCENKYSLTAPLFITLTYADAPEEGLRKRDVQLFLKRLRKRTLKDFPDSVGLRYVVCGEYGRRFGRPHYHMILWNFPYFRTRVELVDFIEESWTHGFVKLCRLDGVDNSKYRDSGSSSAVGYVLKYMRKDCKNPLNYPAEPFFLCSRRGGIGFQYRDEMREFFQQHPEKLDISVLDPYSGKVVTSYLPRYFKSAYFQTVSTLIPKELRKLVDNVSSLYMDYLCYSKALVFKRTGLIRHDWNLHDLNLDPFYKFTKFYFAYLSDTAAPLRYRFISSDRDKDSLVLGFETTLLKLGSALNTLYHYNIDDDLFERLLAVSRIHNNAVSLAADNVDERISIDAKIDTLRKAKALAESREVF